MAELDPIIAVVGETVDGKAILMKPEETSPRSCPDGGRCHHACEGGCFRVSCCGPLSGVFEGDHWPAHIVAEEAAKTEALPEPELPDENVYVLKTLDECTRPVDGYQVLVAHWWPIDAKGRIAFYNPVGRHRRAMHGWGAPQANSNEKLSRMLAAKVHSWAVDVIQIPVVYVPLDLRDY